MLETILENIIYMYYPKGICAYTKKEDYLKTEEYMRFSNIISKAKDNNDCKMLIKRIQTELIKRNEIKKVNDISLLEWEDRCFIYEIEIWVNNCRLQVLLTISILIPYFCLSTRNEEGNYDILLSSDIGDSFRDIIKYIYITTKKLTNFTAFPESVARKKVLNVSFGEVYLGNFTFYNAFFLDS